VNGCVNRIALSIERKFPTAAKLSFQMRHARPSTPDRLYSIAKPHAHTAGTRADRNAIVINRFFDNKRKALA
jgi:hypothetical protein